MVPEKIKDPSYFPSSSLYSGPTNCWQLFLLPLPQSLNLLFFLEKESWEGG